MSSGLACKESRWAHLQREENGVRSGFKCEKGEGRTDFESKMGKEGVSSELEWEERKWTHLRRDENGVKNVFKCQKREDAHTGSREWSKRWIYLQRKRCTYILGYENAVSIGFKCKERDIHTGWETRME